jgi:hypothetical protein
MRTERALILRKCENTFNHTFTLSSFDLDFHDYFLQCIPLDNNILKRQEGIRHFVLLEEIFQLTYDSSLAVYTFDYKR